MSEHRRFPLAGAKPQYGPDKTVDVLHIDLHLVPDLEAQTLHAVCTTTVAAIEDGVADLRLDAVDLLVQSVRAGDHDVTFQSTSDSLVVHFPTPLRAGERITFEVEYRVENPRRGLYFIGPTPAQPNRRRQVWSQSQDQDGRFWFPALDYPHEKQTTSATIVVPRGLFALSNGVLVERRDEGDRTIFRYEQSVPHVTYLMTMVAGEFSEIPQRARVPMWYYVEPGREDDGERSFGKTPKMLDVFESVIGYDYPYERYSQIAVADFIFGGMENTTATTQTDRTLHDERAHIDFSSDSLVAHELAHQWFGDLVTCRDWSQAWLNESFATFFEAVFFEADLGWDEYVYEILGFVDTYLAEDAHRYRRAIVTNVYRDPIELFDRHLYQKGAAVLHMLRGELGWERMRRALRRYVADNAMRNVETIDLIRAIEATSGRNMRAFFDQWIYRPGHPDLEIGYRYDSPRKAAIIEVRQKQHIDEASPPYAFDVTVAVVPAAPQGVTTNAGDGALAGEHRMRVRVERAEEAFAIPSESEPALVRFDVGGYILGTVSYKLGPDLGARILASDPDPIARIRAAKSLAKDPTRVAREALATALGTDPFWGVAFQVARALGSTHAPFARESLLRTRDHTHPKVRRAIAEALGSYRDAGVAEALIAMTGDASYLVAAAALQSLGKTRDPRAFEVLAKNVDVSSWNDVVAAGALRGLAELVDERAVPILVAALGPERSETLRRAAIGALSRAGNLLQQRRTEIVEALLPLFDDRAYFVRVATIDASETLADARLLPALDRAAATEIDGRLRRDAAEAAIRVREAQKIPAEVASLREEIDRLRGEQHALRERLDSLHV